MSPSQNSAVARPKNASGTSAASRTAENASRAPGQSPAAMAWNPASTRPSLTSASSQTTPAGRALPGPVADGFDVVAVGDADEGPVVAGVVFRPYPRLVQDLRTTRSEEHTSELQSRRDLVCRLLLEKKK